MEKEVKHRLKRNRRRERAERMQAQRDHGDSAEDETLSGVKPPRPPVRRKKSKEPVFEEDIIDGFAILAFRSYEELETAVKVATTKNTKYNTLGEDKIRTQVGPRVIHRHSPAPGHDAGTSDDSGRASEVRPSGPPHGHRESSHDRLSDASSRCSSGKGYICDSEGEDDKGSDAGSLFAATPTSTPRKHDLLETGAPQPTPLTNGIGTPPGSGVRPSPSPAATAPAPVHQPNGLTANTRNPAATTLPHFQAPHLDKKLEGDRNSKQNRLESLPPRLDANARLEPNPNDKSRPETNSRLDTNSQVLDKRLESNTHIESKRLDANTHQHLVNNLDKRLDGHLNHLEKGMHIESKRIDGINLHLDKNRLDSVHLDKRIDVLPVHLLEKGRMENPVVPSHIDKRTLENAPGQIDKRLENSVHAPSSLDKRMDAHAPGIMDKGRMERDVSIAHAPVSSPAHGPAIPNSAPPGSHSHSPALPNNPPHQPAVHPGSNSISHKTHPNSLHPNHMYQNPMRTHTSIHNPGLPSHNMNSLHNSQVPPKKPLVLHNPGLPNSIRPPSNPSTTSSVPLSTTSASLVISNSNPSTAVNSLAMSGSSNNLPTTLGLSNSVAGSNSIPQHPSLHSISHLSNPSRPPSNSGAPPRPGSNPQIGGSRSDPNQPGPRTNTPVAPHPGLPNHPSHSISQRLSPAPSSTSTSTAPTSSTSVIPPHPGLPTSTSSSNSGHPSLAMHPGLAPGNMLNNSPGAGSPGIHSGYPLPLSGAPPYPPYPPLYAPYSSTLQHSPYLPPRIDPPISSVGSPVSKQQSVVSGGPMVTTSSAIVTTSTTTSHRDIVTTPVINRSHSPRGHSPNRERDSYSSNVSSLSRGSVTPVSGAPTASPFSSTAPSSSLANPSPFVKNPVWVSTPGPGPTRPSLHPSSFPPPMFAPPMPPPQGPPGPAPFSAESLFSQSNQADFIRRELDTRFLASQERSLGVNPAFLRTEMHHHQHQHTHVHQHQGPSLFPPPPLFKDIPKLGGVDSPFYRGNLGLASYPGFSPGLLGPGLPSTPFAPPSHLPTFTPKQVGDTSKPRIVKSGKWNAMHVRVAWEIYHHQQKQTAEGKSGMGAPGAKDAMLRPPGHLFPPPPGPRHDLSGYPPGFLPPPHMGSAVSPFGRYPPVGSFATPPGGFPGMPGFPTRDINLGSLQAVHDPWRLRGPGAFPVGPSPWSLKPEPTAIDRREIEERERERAEREREREKERLRREREERERERERREREEKRKLEAERERREKERREMERRDLERLSKVRERSPIRNGEVKEEPRPVKDEDVVMLGRTGPTGPYPPHPYSLGRHPGLRPPPLASHFAPPGWPPPPGGDPYGYRLDPLLRYNPLVPYRTEEDEQRAKLYGGYLPPPSHHPPSSPALLKKEESQSR